ncbi:hypothetical protein TNCV_1999131 [Trichonephila clavipes]|nr:hypothetical protein TNCV_1999131 [Trichonephila clavipes]
MPRQKKSDEHPQPSGCGRMSLSSFLEHQDVTGRHSSTSMERRIRTPTAARPQYDVFVIVRRPPRRDQTAE